MAFNVNGRSEKGEFSNWMERLEVETQRNRSLIGFPKHGVALER
jgi:hypothetical protein